MIDAAEDAIRRAA